MITLSRRRALLAERSMLAPHAEPATVPDRLVGLHASDPASVVLSLRARCPRATPADIDDLLWGSRTLMRIHAMRRTLFVVGVDLAAVMHAACGRDLIAPERKRLVSMITSQGLASDAERWIDELSTAVEASLVERTEASARDLTVDVPGLAAKLSFGEGRTWAGTVGMSTRILYLLGIEGRIARTRPPGGWTSGQYRWCLIDRIMPGGFPPIDAARARADLVRRYLAAYGPATMSDLKWWTGWPLSRVRPALVAIGAVEIDTEAGAGRVTPAWMVDEHRDAAMATASDAGRPWAALLPSLDPTVMGWKERDWYVGDHGPRLFDRNGNAGPTVWVDGRIVGGWACAEGGEIRLALLEDIGRDRLVLVEQEADRLTTWLDGVRVTPRFRSPLDLELVPRSR